MKRINSDMLKILACIFMLMDHLWATIVPGNMWLTCVGRLAFPIFAFQIVEGFFHTSNVKKYAQRLFLFALISEIPFNMMCVSSPIYPFHQNVMFTLLIALLAINELEKLRTMVPVPENSRPVLIRSLILGVLKVAFLYLLSVVMFVDYGAAGVLTIILFYLCRHIQWGWIFQLAGMILINFRMLEGLQFEITLAGSQVFFPMQGFAVLALIPIWLYNGQKGRSSKALQYGFYAFYPVHMLVLSLIRLWV